MCLGAKARAANEQLKRDYQHKLDLRERKWMQDISTTRVERLQYEQGIDASNLGLANFYTDIQEKYGEAVDQMFTQSQEDWKQYLTKNEGDQRKAAGRLGRSTDRISAIDLGAYLKKGHDQVEQLTKANTAWNKAAGQAASKARAQQMSMFAANMFEKHPDLVPPQPVGHDVSAAAFMDALQIGTSIIGTAASVAAIPATGGTSAGGSALFKWLGSSDRRLKENIKKLGESPSGLGIYKFNYIGNTKKYIGAMADDVMKVVPEAVSTMTNGFLGVNYNLIDVQFKEVA